MMLLQGEDEEMAGAGTGMGAGNWMPGDEWGGTGSGASSEVDIMGAEVLGGDTRGRGTDPAALPGNTIQLEIRILIHTIQINGNFVI